MDIHTPSPPRPQKSPIRPCNSLWSKIALHNAYVALVHLLYKFCTRFEILNNKSINPKVRKLYHSVVTLDVSGFSVLGPQNKKFLVQTRYDEIKIQTSGAARLDIKENIVMSCRFQGPLKHIKQHFPLVLIRSKAKHYQPRLLLLGNVKIQIIHQGRFNLANSKKMAL